MSKKTKTNMEVKTERLFVPAELCGEILSLGYDKHSNPQFGFWFQESLDNQPYDGAEVQLVRTPAMGLFRGYSVDALLWDQAFDFFRRHGIDCWVRGDEMGEGEGGFDDQDMYTFEIRNFNNMVWKSSGEEIIGYYEAQVACVKHMIELFKEIQRNGK